MSDEELQLLITLDDPGDAAEEDIFNHLHVKNNLAYWLDRRFPTCWRLDQQAEAVDGDDAYKVAFGQGDWTCTMARLTSTMNDSVNGMDIEVCTVTRWKNGEIAEQKVFYDLVGMPKQIAATNTGRSI